ncbi:hypothetical protein HNQ93_001209 [Hymenobacter luteus]|uniref:Uncharacterized protein n=2 Tax=Hymenobacter TaxID=89966 RepID=A0A7W9SZL6_9BACT|nr:hypothetical protein [Hymenobacter latericoloratus]MBB6058363.1 hypothetical protein [Hymenobacter luteus]
MIFGYTRALSFYLHLQTAAGQAYGCAEVTQAKYRP